MISGYNGQQQECALNSCHVKISTHKTNPPLCLCFSQSAHLAMIDTLMMAYTVETVSVEKVMACIHQYSPGNAQVETPYDTEDAVTTWINKVSPRM